jgi:ubiquitin C-terminal hydrolase
MIHDGTLRGGHYTAFGLHTNESKNDIWYYLNDSHTSEVKEDRVLNSRGAYMLFYTRIV